MPTDRFAARRRKLIRQVEKTGAGVLLVTNFTNVTWLTGFSGDDSYLLVGKDLTLLISDSRYETQLQEECPDLDVHVRTNRQPMIEALGEVIETAKLDKLAFESTSATYDLFQKIGEAAESLELVPAPGLVEELRQTKDAEEIKAIRRAIVQAERAFALFKTSLIGRMSELEGAFDLEHAMRRFGASRASFDPIVAAGPRAALPHARPGEGSVTESGFLLIDWGASERTGYKSDLTRVLVTGKIPPKLEKIYGVVLNAQAAGIEAIRPGVKCADVDAAARKVIEDAGFGEHFGHGLGHGIGLDIHEGPRLSPVSEEVLEPGMVVTVEPGLYFPGWGGVRIEDDVLVTRDGHDVLTSVPKAFDEAVVRC